MKTLTLTTAAFLASLPYASALGSANVINQCTSDVYLYNVPSAGGGGVEVDKVIGPGDSYSQTYQTLTNNNGWSLKLSPTAALGQVMQFEYTYQGDSTLWYDISYVNGDPFNGDWIMTSDSTSCVPKQTYYRFSTDDSYGMQAGCSPDVSITVTMCPGGAPADASSSPAPTTIAPAVDAAPAAPAAPSTTEAPAVPAVKTKVHKDKGFAPAFGTAGAAAIVENIFTTFVTQVVTVDYTVAAKRAPEPTGEAKRNLHHHHHHQMRHQHAHL